MELIIEKLIKELGAQLADRNVKIQCDKSVNEHLIKLGFNGSSGARMIERVIEIEIKQRIADEILFGSLEKGGTVHIKCNKKDELKFEFKKTVEKIKH